MATGISKTKWNGNGSSHGPQNDRSSSNVVITYEGKKPAEDILATTTARTKLLWQPKEDQPANRLYLADNLSVLAALLKDDTVRGKVRLVYIDPPFATKMVFQSRSQSD